MRHHDIATVRGHYYDEDRAVAIREVDAFGRLGASMHARLWQLFESWLLQRFPRTERLYADDAGPTRSPEENREFLAGLGYTHVAGTRRTFAKEIVP